MSKCIFDLKWKYGSLCCNSVYRNENISAINSVICKYMVECRQKGHRLNGNVYLLGKGVGSGTEDKKEKTIRRKRNKKFRP